MQQRKKIQREMQMKYEEYFEEGNDDAEKTKATKIAKDVKKTVESYLWLSNEFPLKIQSFLTVLKTLTLGGNTSMQKMKSFLKN